MKMIGDDLFLTQVTVATSVTTILIRLGMGTIEKIFGFSGMYYLNIAINCLSSLAILCFGYTKTGFAVFFLFNRLSGGKL